VNKRTIAIVSASVGALLIFVIYVLVVRGILSEQQQQDTLDAQIQPLESALDAQQQGVEVLSDRQAELATLQAELEEAQFAFPSNLDSTKVLQYVVTAAQTNQVTLLEVQARTPVTITLGVSTYLVFAYDVTVEGDLAAIAGFVEELELGPVETLALDQIVIQASSATSAAYRTKLVVQVYVRH
jgi:Tfp pilus assembly protein PilO